MVAERTRLHTKPLTSEEHLALPQIEGHCDLLDGGLILVSPRPASSHQWVLLQSPLRLGSFVLGRQLGKVYFAPPDIVLRQRPLRTRQLDLMFTQTEWVGASVKDRVGGAPDLIVEILSSGNARLGIEEKLKARVRIDVSEGWSVSPEARSIEVLRLTRKGWKRQGISGLGNQVT